MKSIKRFWQNSGFVITVFLVWRTGLLAFEWLGNLLPFKGSFPYYETVLAGTGLPQWLWQWGNFDGVHYLTVAKSGYDGFGTQVFFPLYPFLTGILGRLSGNYLLSALLVSNLAALLAALIFYRLVKQTVSETVAKWTIVFLFAFPTSFFFGSVYTESLFLLLIILAFILRGAPSLVASVLAGATRLVGLFLGPSAALGLITYAIYLGWRFGRPFFFLSAQSAFSNNRADSFTTLVNPLQVIYRYLKIFFQANPAHYDFWIAMTEFVAFIFGVVLLWKVTWKRQVPVSWLLFSWPALLLPVFSGTFSSMPRYLLAVFPIFISLALLKSKKAKLTILLVFVVLLGLFTMLFTRGYWIS